MSEITGIISLRLRLTSPAAAPFFHGVEKWRGGKEVRGQRAEVRGQENRTAEQPLRSASAATEQPGGRMGHFVANGSGGVQELLDPMENRLRIPKPALPNDDYAPAQAAEPADMFFVVGNIPCEFIHPKLPVALGSGGIFAPLVAVPEATVDEYHGPVPRQNNVRLARQVLDVKPETVACAVQQAADLPLRAGVCGPYLRHVPASFSF